MGFIDSGKLIQQIYPEHLFETYPEIARWPGADGRHSLHQEQSLHSGDVAVIGALGQWWQWWQLRCRSGTDGEITVISGEKA